MNPPADSAARIVALYAKPAPDAPRMPCLALELVRGQGIAGDVHANPMNPRQVLVTRQEDLAAFGLEPGQLLENIVIAGASEADFVSGARLQFGPDAALRLTMHCEPCQRIAAYVSPKAIIGKRGLLGVVTASGVVHVGDAVQLDPTAYPALSEKPYQRFLTVLAQVPAGQVIDYRTMLFAMGVLNSYMRAIPRYLRQAQLEAPGRWPLHRLVDSRGQVIPQHLPDQPAQLKAEGVMIDANGSIDLAHYAWTDEKHYLLSDPHQLDKGSAC